MTATALPMPRKRASKKVRNETLLFYMCVAPFILGILFFDLIPLLGSLGLSFTSWDILSPPKWVGLRNYIYALTQDPNFPITFKVTFTYAIAAVPLRLAAALFLAILLNEATKAVGVFSTAFYLPAIVSAVAAAVLWTWLLNPVYGPINGFLHLFGIQGPQWFTDPKY